MPAITSTFSPPVGATTRQVRINGAITFIASTCIFFGFFYVSVAFESLVHMFCIRPALMTPVALIFYALAMVGSYRLLAGQSPQATHSGELSLRRLLLGISSVLMAVGAVVVGAIRMDYFNFGSAPQHFIQADLSKLLRLNSGVNWVEKRGFNEF